MRITNARDPEGRRALRGPGSVKPNPAENRAGMASRREVLAQAAYGAVALGAVGCVSPAGVAESHGPPPSACGSSPNIRLRPSRRGVTY